MIDPRLFLGIPGPNAAPQALTPGFRPPGPGPIAPMMQGQPLPMGIPGMGMGTRGPNDWQTQRTAGGGDLGGYSKTGPGGMVDVGGGVMLPNPNDPASYGTGSQTASGGSPFMAWLRGLF